MVYVREIEDKMDLLRKKYKDNKELISQMNDGWNEIYCDICDFEELLNDHLEV